ncbi:unnamed protein product, partial [Staurois parvus]
CKRQAGRVNINRAGRYRGSGREWSGSQARDQNRRSQQRSESSRVSNKTGTGTGAGCRNKIQGPGKTQHQGRVCRSECPLNTPV